MQIFLLKLTHWVRRKRACRMDRMQWPLIVTKRITKKRKMHLVNVKFNWIFQRNAPTITNCVVGIFKQKKSLYRLTDCRFNSALVCNSLFKFSTYWLLKNSDFLNEAMKKHTERRMNFFSLHFNYHLAKSVQVN